MSHSAPSSWKSAQTLFVQRLRAHVVVFVARHPPEMDEIRGSSELVA